MLIVLPKGKTPAELEAVEKSLSTDTLARWRAALHPATVKVALPKFKITWGSFLLNEPLQSLGMKDAFVGGLADFSGINGERDLFIGEVLHKAFVEVNEEGTEAAAATAIGIMRMAAPLAPPVFRADHPFLFFIQDRATGSLLFMGRMQDPSEK